MKEELKKTAIFTVLTLGLWSVIKTYTDNVYTKGYIKGSKNTLDLLLDSKKGETKKEDEA